MLALYRIEDAAETVSAIIAARIIPCTLEFLDRMTAGCRGLRSRRSADRPRSPADGDGRPPGDVADESERMAYRPRRRPMRAARAKRKGWRWPRDECVFRSGARADHDPGGSRCRGRWRKVIHRADGARGALEIGTFGHMGDRNLHPTFHQREERREMQRVHHALDDRLKTLALGGTITRDMSVWRRRVAAPAVGESTG